MAYSDWYVSHPEWAIPGNAPLMSEAVAMIPDMTPVLERLIALKTAATSTIATLEYVDVLWTTTVDATRRPGDLDRCATLLDELIAEIATTRAPQRPSTGAYAAEHGIGGTGAHTAPNQPQEQP